MPSLRRLAKAARLRVRARRSRATSPPTGVVSRPDVVVGKPRTSQRHDRSETALRAALDHAPTDPQLLVRLTEVLVLQEAWEEAIATWGRSQLALSAPQVTAETAGLLARAHRALGRLEASAEVAAAGLARWPDGTILRQELAKVRTLTTDWTSAVELASPVEPTPAGQVTSLGALAGEVGPIEGWVTATKTGTTTVAVEVDGLAISTTHARDADADADDLGTRRPFSLRCDQVREYLGDDARLRVVSGGVPLALLDGGMTATFRTGYPNRVDELHARLAAGHVFTKLGSLRGGHTTTGKQRTLALFRDVAEVVAAVTGQTCTPFYGNLLGAVREHDFIVHDVGGFDVGYVSGLTDGGEVRAELVRVGQALLDAGYHLVLEPWSIAIRTSSTARIFVDLNVGCFIPTGELHLSYGWRYPPVTDEVAYRRARQAPLAGEAVAVPGNAEAVLEQCYGPRWRIPDQGFDLGHRLQRDGDLLLSRADQEAVVDHRPDRARIATVLGPDGEPVPWPGPDDDHSISSSNG